MLIRLIVESHFRDSFTDHLAILPCHIGTLPPLPIGMLERPCLPFKYRIVILSSPIRHQDLWLCNNILQIQQTRVGNKFTAEPESLHILRTLFRTDSLHNTVDKVLLANRYQSLLESNSQHYRVGEKLVTKNQLRDLADPTAEPTIGPSLRPGPCQSRDGYTDHHSTNAADVDVPSIVETADRRRLWNIVQRDLSSTCPRRMRSGNNYILERRTRHYFRTVS